MKNFLKKQREYIALAVFLTAVFLLIFFVIIPLLKKIEATKNEMEAAAINQELKRQRLGELPKIREQYAEINSQQRKTDILLSKKQAVILIERLEKLAQDTGNKISISIQEDAQSKNSPASSGTKSDPAETALADGLPNKNYLKLKIQLSGNYDGIFKFIGSLETLEYYSDIVSMNIGRTDQDQSSFGQGSAGNFDALSPFNGGQTSINSAAEKKRTGELVASLETVFYSKD